MKHKIGIFHLVMIGLSGTIGSGWLFASMYAAKYAGAGAYVAWIVGALLMLLFCLCLSELVS
jgi:amino acid transporter